jgi:hypothetical protein
MDIFEKCAKATEYESGLKGSGHYFFFGSSNPRRILRWWSTGSE